MARSKTETRLAIIVEDPTKGDRAHHTLPVGADAEAAVARAAHIAEVARTKTGFVVRVETFTHTVAA